MNTQDIPVVIYHNTRCSKSRSACEIVAAQGIDAQIINYLETPPGKEELRALLKKLGIRPEQLVRRGEEVFKANYAGKILSDEAWLDAMVSHPILIERPIVVLGDRAIIARPPESVLDLIGDAD